MDNKELSRTDYQFFFLKTLLWLGLGWVCFVSALAGFFYASIIWLVFLASAAVFFRQIKNSRISWQPSREMLITSLLFLTVVTAFSFFTTPTVFSGRDQGSLSEAAARLAQNHSLNFSTPASAEFFKLHKEGRAQNFPGFYYTQSGSLTTQFPLAYICYLAFFYATFGVAGFALANATLFYIFLLSFYLLARVFLSKGWSAFILLSTLTSLPMLWFAKFTLSENMALPLVWIAVLALVLFLKTRRKLHYVVFSASALLLFFTRIEGIALLAAGAIIIAIHEDARDFIKSSLKTRFWLPLGLLIILFAADVFRDVPFYKEIVKAVMPTITLPKAKYLGTVNNAALPDFYFSKVFYLYGMLGFFVAGLLGAATAAFKKDFYKLVPFFFIAPTLIYFFDSQITPDHPWMLRRFVFSLLPAAILYSGFLLSTWQGQGSQAKKAFMRVALPLLLAIFLVGANLPAFFKYAAFSENRGLLSQAQNLGQQFSSKDLVLMDREVSGDGWSMLAAPLSFLYGKNAVYFFNTQDLSKLDLSRFENVYLVTPNSQAPYYLSSTIGKKLTQTGDFSLFTARLQVGQDNPLARLSLPEKKEFTVNGKIFRIEK